MLRSLCPSILRLGFHQSYTRRSSTMAQSVSFMPVAASRIDIPKEMTVTLSEDEERLCALLDECTRHLAEKGTRTSCRIAGGWVRDKVCPDLSKARPILIFIAKLLGSDSNDIDVALEDMMGHPFAVEFADYASNAKHVDVKSIATVKGNPDQSKHLETAKTAVFGLDLDFVNLRAEEYAISSRIPTAVVRFTSSRLSSPLICSSQSFGTPLQDSIRRDTTINSLFYNVHTRSVEDHCGSVRHRPRFYFGLI
jgi:tRNA nucleotidyltransferase (CCA-adding enzyme)